MKDAENFLSRYNAMRHTLAGILECSLLAVDALMDSGIDAVDVINEYVDDFGEIPSWSSIYEDAFLIFAHEHALEPGRDIAICADYVQNTAIYARKGLSENIVREMEELFGMKAQVLG